MADKNLHDSQLTEEGGYLQIDPRPSLTVFDVTIEHIDGEALDDTKRRLAYALLESLPESGGLRVLGTTTSGDMQWGL